MTKHNPRRGFISLAALGVWKTK